MIKNKETQTIIDELIKINDEVEMYISESSRYDIAYGNKVSALQNKADRRLIELYKRKVTLDIDLEFLRNAKGVLE